MNPSTLRALASRRLCRASLRKAPVLKAPVLAAALRRAVLRGTPLLMRPLLLSPLLVAPLLVAPLLAALGGCNDLNRFDTSGKVAYCGKVIDGSFVRQGFERQLELELELDMAELQTKPGTLTSFDAETGVCAPQPRFNNTPLLIPQEILADPLSLLEFGDAREYNFLGWVTSSCEGPMLAVVSLMKNDDVEVRLLKSQTSAEPGSGFGVFQLKRREDCGK